MTVRGAIDNATVNQGVMQFRDTAVVAIALVANKGDNIEAELVLGQGQAAFRFGPIGLAHLRAVGIETTANL